MIRNYQRSGGGGNVDLGPVYNSLNALQNEVNSLITLTRISTLTQLSTLTSISTGVTGLTELSTNFTSHTSLYASKFNTLESIVTDDSGRIDSLSSSVNINAENINSLSSSVTDNRGRIDSLSSSVMDINGIISTLSTITGGGGGGDITLTNPTETANHLFTDPVLYSGPNMINSNFYPASNISNNTYMKGVTWRDAPETAGEYGRGQPCWFEGCAIYGDMSIVNVDGIYVSNCTVSSCAIHTATMVNIESGGTISSLSMDSVADAYMGGNINKISVEGVSGLMMNYATVEDIRLSKCTNCTIGDAYIYHLHPLDVTQFSLYNCRVKDISIDYPASIDWVSYGNYILGNTIDKMNASMVNANIMNNDIWTANIFMDYNKMYTDPGHYCLSVAGNVMNELSIFENNHGLAHAYSPQVTGNRIVVGGNNVRRLWYDLYCPITVNNCTIETLENTIGANLYADFNCIQEWDCEVTPFSAMLYTGSATGLLANVMRNTVGKWNIYHGLSDESFTSNSALSTKVIDALDKQRVSIYNNSVSYLTIDVLNPLSIMFSKSVISLHIDVANDISFSVIAPIGTMNMVKNERFNTNVCTVSGTVSSVHSIGLTNVYPYYSGTVTVEMFNMYADDGLNGNTGVSNMRANTMRIMNFNTVSDGQLDVQDCSANYFHYEQLTGASVYVQHNTIDYCTIIGGKGIVYPNTFYDLYLNMNTVTLWSNTIGCLGGTCHSASIIYNSLGVGGFYYSKLTTNNNTVVRLNTAF